MTITLTPETQRTIAFVTSRFFLIQADGTIRHRDEYGMVEYAFQRRATALIRAGRQGARVWDKQSASWVS